MSANRCLSPSTVRAVCSNGTGNHPNAVTGLIVARDCILAEMMPK